VTFYLAETGPVSRWSGAASLRCSVVPIGAFNSNEDASGLGARCKSVAKNRTATLPHKAESPFFFEKVVGATGFEPATPCAQGEGFCVSGASLSMSFAHPCPSPRPVAVVRGAQCRNLLQFLATECHRASYLPIVSASSEVPKSNASSTPTPRTPGGSFSACLEFPQRE
jgi:hypothetical protein